MKNDKLKINQHGAQTTGLGVIISRCSLDTQHGGTAQHPANVGCSSSRYTKDSSFRSTNNEQVAHSQQRPQRRTWTREDFKKLTLFCYFRSNPAKRGYRKRIIEIWAKFGRFKVRNQRLDDQVRTIKNNGLFSDLKILEIHQQIYRQTHQQTPYTETEILNTGKPETPNQILHDNDPFTVNTNTNTDPRGKKKLM